MRRIISLLLVVVLICSEPLMTAFADTGQALGANTQIGEPFEASYVDPAVLFRKNVVSTQTFNTALSGKKNIIFQNVQMHYDTGMNILSFNADIIDGEKVIAVSGIGNVYNREHANYEVCYLIDLNLEQNDFTVVYMELFNENSCDKLRVYIERNENGDMYNTVTEIESGLLSVIDKNARDIRMTEEQHMNLIVLNKKSPNHSFERSNNVKTFQDPSREIKVNEENEGFVTRTELLDAWIELFDAQKNNFNLKYSDYDVDQNFFDSLTKEVGVAQWETYVSNPGYNYRVVRCAYYQVFSDTYTFYYALVRPRDVFSGDLITFNFGFVDFPNTVHPASYSYRVELNKNTKTMRYVSDYGLKFKPTLTITLNAGTFLTATCDAKIKDTANAANIAEFAIGLIPKGVGTAIGMLQLLLENGIIIPKVEVGNDRIWVKEAGDEEKRDVAVSFDGKSVSCYKPGDQLFIHAETSGASSANFKWQYSVSD